MSAAVRCYAYSGVKVIPVASGSGQYVAHSAFFWKEPYLARETLTASTGAAVGTSAALAESNGASCLRVQVESNKRVHIEINPPSRSVQATTDSPIISGEQTVDFGPGWSISVLEAS